MLHILIRLAYMEAAALLGLALIYVLVKQGVLRNSLHAFFASIVMTCAILGLSFNIWVSFALLIVMAIALCRRREHIPGILLLSILLIPNIRLFLYVGSIRLVDIGLTDAVSLAAVAALLAKGGRAKVSRWADLCALLLFTLLVLFSARDTSVTNYARVICQTILNDAVPYWVITRSLRTLRDFQIFALHLIAAGCALAGFLLFEAFTGWPVFREITAQYGMDPLWNFIKWRNGMLRTSGPFLEPTSMALGMMFIALAAWQFRSLFTRPVYRYAIFALLCAGMALCQSRNAFLGLGTGLIAIEAFRRLGGTRGRWMLPVLAVGLIAAPIVYFVAKPPVVVVEDTEATALYRYNLMVRGLEEIRKNPLLGVNREALEVSMADIRQGEHIIDFVNMYIYVGLLSGIIGFVLFVTILSYGVFAPLKAVADRVSGADPLRQEGAGYIFAVSVVTMGALFFTFCGGRIELMVMVFIGLAGCIGRMAASDARPKRRPSPGALPQLPALA